MEDTLRVCMGTEDSTITIRGDSMQVIRMLFRQLDKVNMKNVDIYIQLYELAESISKWHNTIPDYLKTGSVYKTLDRQLMKLGFEHTRKTKKK